MENKIMTFLAGLISLFFAIFYAFEEQYLVVGLYSITALACTYILATKQI